MLTYPWKCTVLHCNHLGNTWKPLVLMTRHFDYHPRSGNNQSVGSSAPVVSRCFPGGYNVKLHISRSRLAWWLLAFLCCVMVWVQHIFAVNNCRKSCLIMTSSWGINLDVNSYAFMYRIASYGFLHIIRIHCSCSSRTAMHLGLWRKSLMKHFCK